MNGLNWLLADEVEQEHLKEKMLNGVWTWVASLKIQKQLVWPLALYLKALVAEL